MSYSDDFFQPPPPMICVISWRSGSTISWCCAMSNTVCVRRSVVVSIAAWDRMSCATTGSYRLSRFSTSCSNHAIASLYSGTGRPSALAAALAARRASITPTRMQRASATCARSLRHGGRNQCTTGRRAGGHRRNRYAAMYAVFVYSVVILSHASLRAPSSPRKTRDESRAISCKTCSRRVISHHSGTDSSSAQEKRTTDPEKRIGCLSYAYFLRRESGPVMQRHTLQR